MRFSVRHETLYRYATPVRLADHLLRLTPRPENIRLHRHELTIDPVPVSRDDRPDPFGNPITHLAFDGATDRFRIESRFELETMSAARGVSDAPSLPWTPDPAPEIAPYLAEADPDDTVRAFAFDLAGRCDWRVPAFLSLLTRSLFERTDRHIRPDGHARSAARTLALGSGACRDLTVLFLATTRALGIPARFVSGYQARAETPDGRRHLHAWPEVLIPASGWHGFDPTHGVAVEDGHVALSAAPDQLGTMPLEGGYFGEAVASTLDYTVEIDAD